MLNLCGIVVAILKMATSRNFSMSGITSKNFYRPPFSKWPPQYRTNSTLFDFNVLNWFPTLKNFYRSAFSKWLLQLSSTILIWIRWWELKIKIKKMYFMIMMAD
jgi:hypothetical protein